MLKGLGRLFVVLGVVLLAGAAQGQSKAAEPSAPTPQGQVQVAAPTAQTANPFPVVNPKNFTAASPTVEEVNSFLKALWGYDDGRTWSVAGILKTTAPDVAKVVVYVADKASGSKAAQTVFYTTPDGKHAIAGEVIDFGAKPFEANRKVLEARANGPAEGAAGKELELVEFADLQCPHCKDAQETMENLRKEFPQAHIVFENLPIPELHPYAMRAAAEGVCVRKAKGDAAFFTYAAAVFARQSDLTPTGVDAALEAAVTAAGDDPKDAAECAKTDLATDDIHASMALASDLNVNQTPMLAVNGQVLAMNGIPYDTLKRIIAFRAGQDGVTVHLQPTLSNLK
jgi:protein-disulfide isomerase